MFKCWADICDVVSVLIYCKIDKEYYYLLQSTNDDQFKLPSSPAGSNSWKLSASELIQDVIGSNVTTSNLIKIFRLWIPESPFLHHVVFELVILPQHKIESKLKAKKKEKKKLLWCNYKKLVDLKNGGSFNSYELFMYITQISRHDQDIKESSQNDKADSKTFSIIGPDTLIEISNNDCIFNTDFEPPTLQSNAVKAAHFTIEDQKLLFKEFVLLCFPDMLMSRVIFDKFLSTLGWRLEDFPDIFRAADIDRRGALLCKDFICFLAVMEPTATDENYAIETRCRCVFRYFDMDNDNTLNYQELKNLLQAVKHYGIYNNINMDKEIAYISELLNSVEKSLLLLPVFLKTVVTLQLKGFSFIFRGRKEIIPHINDLQARRQSRPVINETSTIMRSASLATINTVFKMFSLQPANKSKGEDQILGYNQRDYQVAGHTVFLNKSGGLKKIYTVHEVAESKTFSVSGIHPDPFLRFKSMNYFNKNNMPNQLLKGLHYFSQAKPAVEQQQKADKLAFSWGESSFDIEGYADCLTIVCEMAISVLAHEKRLLELKSPVYILGDLHGNYHDLLVYEHILWRLGPKLGPSSILFLGDYVDRGAFGIEVVGYLFAQKVKTPEKIFLLRGNHEIREIQTMFTFHLECQKKFGAARGTAVWECVNKVFDVMPLAAVIDNKVFCCHGGIPPPWLCPTINTINTIPVLLPRPSEQSVLAWELMWNDPCRSETVSESMQQELAANEGFVKNTNRGTGHMFSVSALEKFLTVNGLSHVVRAHEVKLAGFQIHQKGKLLTVFSSSRYCGGINDAAFIMAENKKLRIFRIDTQL